MRPGVYKVPAIPRALTSQEVQQVFAACDNALSEIGTCALPMQARQQSRADATGGAPGVLEFTSRSTVLPM